MVIVQRDRLEESRGLGTSGTKSGGGVIIHGGALAKDLGEDPHVLDVHLGVARVERLVGVGPQGHEQRSSRAHHRLERVEYRVGPPLDGAELA